MDYISGILIPVLILRREGEESRRRRSRAAATSSRRAPSKWVPGAAESVLEEAEARRQAATCLHLPSDE